MKTLFTHAYYINEDPKEKEIMRPYPPLGILYLSAWLEKHGVDNEVFDSTFSSSNAQKEYLLNNPPGVIGIYANLMTKPNVIRLMKFIRSEGVLTDTLIVLGGPDVTYNAAKYLQAGADLLIIGEGEQTMLEVVREAEKKENYDFSCIDGLAFFDKNNTLVKTSPRARIRPVDDLPFPNRKKIDIQNYLKAWKNHHGVNALSLSTQRGCPYTCKWCSTAVYGQSYRRRSPQLVVEEMEYLQETYKPDTIWFVDDVFTVSHKWLEEFEVAIKASKVRIPFECITRADRLNDEIVKTLKSSGCFRVWIGAESGSQKIIDAMDRRVDVDQVRDMIRETRKQGIQAGTFIMLGYPGETESDIRETIEHLKISNPDHFTITVAYPIKGTGLYAEVESGMMHMPDWETSTDRDLDFKRSYSRPYYNYAVRWVVNSVNLHKKQLEKKDLSLQASLLRMKILSARVGMQWHKFIGQKQGN